jgi:hypothetical protein
MNILTIYAGIGYSILILATATHVYHHFFWLPRVRRELFALNKRRSDLVRDALASGQEVGFAASPAPTYPFATWIDLRSDGAIVSAGQSFRTTEPFTVTARDHRNLPRASASCDGKGNGVLITSHGLTFVAHFADGQWDVRTTNSHPHET